MNRKLPNGGVANGTPRNASIGSIDDTLLLLSPGLLLLFLDTDGCDDVDDAELLPMVGDGDDCDGNGGDVFGGVIRIPLKNPYLVLICRGDKVLSKIDDSGDEDATMETLVNDDGVGDKVLEWPDDDHDVMSW